MYNEGTDNKRRSTTYKKRLQLFALQYRSRLQVSFLLTVSLFCAAATFLALTATTILMTEPSSRSSLSRTYQSIAEKAVDRAASHAWPDSTEATKVFPKDDHGAFKLPTFPDAEGALAVTAFLDPATNRNKGAASILTECTRAFDKFVGDLHSIMHMATPTQILSLKDELETNVWRVPPGTHHLTLAVFQEHPSMFWREEDKARCNLVDNTEAELIRWKMANFVAKSGKMHPPKLQLDSLLLTDTGAMIAGFIDVTPKNDNNNNDNQDNNDPFRTGTSSSSPSSSSCSFEFIRETCIKVAVSVIGKERLTSRPKNLIHTTLGRVLKLPETLTTPQKEGIAQLIKTYNTEILPDVVQKLHHEEIKNENGLASFDLTEITMVREIVWTLQKFDEFQTWHLK